MKSGAGTKKRAGFTLLELLVVVVVIAVLAMLAIPAVERVRLSMWKGVSTHTLEQLAAAGSAYRADHDMDFWPSRQFDKQGNTTWWFGWEGSASWMGMKEGEREVDYSQGPLGPYVIASGGFKSDPAFMAFGRRLKPKYKNGNYGYGYNTELGGGPLGVGKVANILGLPQAGEIVVFATCAQVNDFQPPASPSNPMIEEFYLFSGNDRTPTLHFRYGGKALAAMADGSVRELAMDPDTRDQRLPEANIGRLAPYPSKKYLWPEE